MTIVETSKMSRQPRELTLRFEERIPGRKELVSQTARLPQELWNSPGLNADVRINGRQVDPGEARIPYHDGGRVADVFWERARDPGIDCILPDRISVRKQREGGVEGAKPLRELDLPRDGGYLRRATLLSAKLIQSPADFEKYVGRTVSENSESDYDRDLLVFSMRYYMRDANAKREQIMSENRETDRPRILQIAEAFRSQSARATSHGTRHRLRDYAMFCAMLLNDRKQFADDLRTILESIPRSAAPGFRKSCVYVARSINDDYGRADLNAIVDEIAAQVPEPP